MHPVTATSRAWKRHPVLIDVTAVVVLFLADLILAAGPADDPRSATEMGLTAAALAAVPLRNRFPVPALALTTLGTACALLFNDLETTAFVAPLLALYVVGLRSDRRAVVVAWALTAAVLLTAAALGTQPDERWQEALSVLPWTGVVAAVGQGLRSRRSYLAAIEERAERAERSREEEALRRVAEERVRIARELHDVVAHHIAVVSVQAGAAQHLLTADPAAAAAALGHVRRSAGAVLEELGDILTVLRQPGEPEGTTTPAPGLARLDALVGSFAAAGLAVDWSLRGQPRELPATIDVVAYRVVEEALTNALMHGTGTAHLDVGYEPSSLRLRVVSATPVPVVTGSRPGTGGRRHRPRPARHA